MAYIFHPSILFVVSYSPCKKQFPLCNVGGVFHCYRIRAREDTYFTNTTEVTQNTGINIYIYIHIILIQQHSYHYCSLCLSHLLFMLLYLFVLSQALLQN
jgi:hypothetical protein